MMPCSKFLFLATIFPKNFGERGLGGGGGGGWGGGCLKKNFRTLKTRVKKNFPDINHLNYGSKNVFRTNSCSNMGETLIFGPISVKFGFINSTQFPLKAL